MNGAPWGPPDPTERGGTAPPPPEWATALRARRAVDTSVAPTDRAARRSPVVLGWLGVAGASAVVFGLGLPRLAQWQRDRDRPEPVAELSVPANPGTQPTSTPATTAPPASFAPPGTSSAEDRALTQTFVARIEHLELDPLTASAAGRALCDSLTRSNGDVVTARDAGSVLVSSGSLAEEHLDEVFSVAVEVFCPQWTAVWTAG